MKQYQFTLAQNHVKDKKANQDFVTNLAAFYISIKFLKIVPDYEVIKICDRQNTIFYKNALKETKTCTVSDQQNSICVELIGDQDEGYSINITFDKNHLSDVMRLSQILLENNDYSIRSAYSYSI